MSDRVEASKELLALLGSVWYTHYVMNAGTQQNRMPAHIRVPEEYLRAAHFLTDGHLINVNDLAFKAEQPEDVMTSYFEDAQGQAYLYLINLKTGDSILRANENSTTEKPSSETLLWAQAVKLAVNRRRDYPENHILWGAVEELAALDLSEPGNIEKAKTLQNQIRFQVSKWYIELDGDKIALNWTPKDNNENSQDASSLPDLTSSDS